MILLPTPQDLFELENGLAEEILTDIVVKQAQLYQMDYGTTCHFPNRPPNVSENDWATALCVAVIELAKRGWKARQIRDEHGEWIQILNPRKD